MPANTPQPANIDTKPQQAWAQIVQTAIKAQGLVNDNAAALGGRIVPAFFSQFGADITGLSAAVPAAMTAHTGAAVLTAAQGAACEVGANLVKGVRTAVKGQRPPPAVQAAYGVGQLVNKQVVSSVRTALETISTRIAAQPAEAATFGIATEDATAVTNALTAIEAADQAQEAARAGAPKTTKARNATARRLLAGIRLIAGAGMRTFASNKTLFDNFAALVGKGA
jgi:hypothetical protein